MSLLYDWHAEGLGFTEPIVCAFHYEPPEPTAFPGTQGANCTLEWMTIAGVTLPLRILSDQARAALEAEALEWFQQSAAEDAADAAIASYA
jgi:hypothetical protein